MWRRASEEAVRKEPESRTRSAGEGMAPPAWTRSSNSPVRAALKLLFTSEQMITTTSTPPPCPLTQLEPDTAQGFKLGRNYIQPKTFWRAGGLFTGQAWSQHGAWGLGCWPARPLCRSVRCPGSVQGAGNASTDSDVMEQSLRRKGRGEQLSNDKRFQALLTGAGFNLAGKDFVSHYQAAAPGTSLPSCTISTSFLKINYELFSPCNK